MKHVLLIEDDPIEKIKLNALLIELGYTNITAVPSLSRAQAVLETNEVSLIIADVHLQGETSLSIISNALAVSIPTIFTTASKDITIYETIQNNHLYGYLIKPVDLITLRATINLVTHKLKRVDSLPNVLLIRQGNKQYKVPYTDILWLETEGNYSFIHAVSGKYAIKKSLRRIISELGGSFVQCHKKFCVNLDHVTSLKRDTLVVKGHEIPMTYFFKKVVVERLSTIRDSYPD